MLVYILLWWIGTQLNAPMWYYVTLGVLVVLNMLKYGWAMFKRGAEIE